MRYFRHISSGCIEAHRDKRQLSDFLYPKDWEEVIVTPKPHQPKKHKIKLALFRWPSFESLFELTEQIYMRHYKRNDLIQVTDWVEVDFVEKV